MTKRLTAHEATNELDYNVDHLCRLLKQGTIKADQFNRVWMIDPADVERIKTLQGPGGRLPRGYSQN